jgi:small membrane protein
MIQKILALFIIALFLGRLFWQRRKKQIGINEFIFWLIFWLMAGFLILVLKQIDQLAIRLGFSSSGIEILLYLGIVVLFYLIFRLRLKMEKMEKNITKIVRKIALKEE